MALDPAATDLSRLPPPDAPGPHFAMGPDVGLSSRRIGERMVADQIAWLGAKGRKLLADYAALRSTARLATFDQVEALWEDVVKPALANFETMRIDPDTPAPPQCSIWRANWRPARRLG